MEGMKSFSELFKNIKVVCFRFSFLSFQSLIPVGNRLWHHPPGCFYSGPSCRMQPCTALPALRAAVGQPLIGSRHQMSQVCPIVPLWFGNQLTCGEFIACLGAEENDLFGDTEQLWTTWMNPFHKQLSICRSRLLRALSLMINGRVFQLHLQASP